MPDTLNNIFIPYQTGDTDVRPLPSGVNFWSGPGVTLDPSHGAVDASTYNVGTPCNILVEVQNNSSVVYEVINVELWVCDYTTVVGPDTALYPNTSAQAAGLADPTHSTSYKTLTGGAAPTGAATTISVVATPASGGNPAQGFVPYPGMSSLPGGHVCLIANCWGITSEGISDGNSLLSVIGVNLPNEVQTNGHIAQHNVFASSGQMQRQGMPWQITVPFLAATPLQRGSEEVILEIKKAIGPLTKDDLRFLHDSDFKRLPLHPSTAPVKAFEIHGCHGGPGQQVKEELHAGRPLRLSIEAEMGPGNTVGGVHAFDVIQTSSSGKVQGGLRLLAVVAH